jgi:hypothetical protein
MKSIPESLPENALHSHIPVYDGISAAVLPLVLNAGAEQL